MAIRRRYDTVELVAEIKKERRNGIILALTGVGILMLLLGLYVTGVGDEDVPTIPTAAVSPAMKTPEPKVDEPKPDVDLVKPAPGSTGGVVADAPAADEAEPEPKPKPEPEKAVAKPAIFRVVLTKKGILFVDGKKIGKGKKHRLELSAEKHEIKAKFGRKIVTYKVLPKAGQTYELRFDARKRKAFLKKK